ncbi:hypothetical protein AAV94_07395 [Lampropedia cohaerens]|uniref:Uncharacterized protein n=1 Tax=Lampropedia cohaerens TaxID=1610491 RepID=A0A0U1PZR8_9BURK|nr:hypothetical protein [Lampropedia cohaerens]KKW67987.1 hypothetical protein AAV94_07395 [Lampropedia cohaerens]
MTPRAVTLPPTIWPHRSWRRDLTVLAMLAGYAAAAPTWGAARIQPQDGYWTWDVGTAQSSASCVPGIDQALIQLLPTQRGEHVRFASPFHPRQLIAHEQVQWQQPSANHFVATADGVTVQGFALPMSVRYELHVLSPTQMRGEAVVTMQMLQACAVSATFTFVRHADTGHRPATPATDR